MNIDFEYKKLNELGEFLTKNFHETFIEISQDINPCCIIFSFRIKTSLFWISAPCGLNENYDPYIMETKKLVAGTTCHKWNNEFRKYLLILKQ